MSWMDIAIIGGICLIGAGFGTWYTSRKHAAAMLAQVEGHTKAVIAALEAKVEALLP